MIALLAQSETTTDATWRLETHWTFAPWLTVVFIAAAIGLVVYCYTKERSPAGAAYRTLLGALRLTTVLLILIMLSELLLAGTRTGRSRFGWVIDLSGSMSIVDPPAPGEGQSGEGAQPSRIGLVKQALLAGDAELLTKTGEGYDLDFVTAGDKVKNLSGDLPTALEEIAALESDASAMSPLGDAVHGLVNQASRPPPQAVVIWTDGRNTTGRSLAAAAESARRAGTPLYFVGVGSQQSPPDVILSDPLADEVVFVEDILSLGAALRVKGNLASPVRITLTRDDDPTVLAEQTIDPSDARSTVPIQLLHRPTKPGIYRYTIAAQPVEGERDTKNNTVHLDVEVRDASVRVLLAAGYPMYEYRYLKSLLERDSTIELRTYLQESDLEYAESDETAINRFPLRRREFDKYDVVVLMDLDPRLLPRTLWGELRRFVSSDGGGLVLVAGPRYLPWSYRSVSEFHPLSPVKMDSVPISNRTLDDAYLVRPTQLGMRSTSFQLGDNRKQSETLWRGLTPLYWYANIGQPKPAAQVLASHPTATATDGRAAPLIVSQYFGAGQVLMHAMDATYLWRRRVGDVYFARYWVQTMRRLAHGRLKRDDRGWELTVERGEYERGEPVRVRLNTTGGGASQATILLQPDSGPQRKVELSPSTVRPGVLETELIDLPVGRYRALLAGGQAGAASATFEVVAPPGEFAQLEMDASSMQAAAQRTGGEFLTIDQASDLLDKIPQAQRVPIESLPPVELWNRWWMLAGICGCLTVEWILRKRKSML